MGALQHHDALIAMLDPKSFKNAPATSLCFVGERPKRC
jgi:hypothetical protein